VGIERVGAIIVVAVGTVVPKERKEEPLTAVLTTLIIAPRTELVI
jgi:hypothetical protein